MNAWEFVFVQRNDLGSLMKLLHGFGYCVILRARLEVAYWLEYVEP